MDKRSKYRPWFPELACWMARNGLTADEIAHELGVHKGTLYDWRAKYREFAEAMDNGRDLADARVENALYTRAIGFTRTVDKLSKDGDAVPCEEEVPGDVTAQIFWLKNRRPEHWRDVNRHEHTGADGKPIATKQVPASREELIDALTDLVIADAEQALAQASSGAGQSSDG